MASTADHAPTMWGVVTLDYDDVSRLNELVNAKWEGSDQTTSCAYDYKNNKHTGLGRVE